MPLQLTKTFLDINITFQSSSTANIYYSYCLIKSAGRLWGIYMVPLGKFDPTQYLLPNSLLVACDEQMGNILNICLLKNILSMEDVVLCFAISCSLTKPSNYCGYHLLHYLLCNAMNQAPTFNPLLAHADFPDLYNFSSTLLD